MAKKKFTVKASTDESNGKKFRIDIYDKNNPDGLKNREYKSFATKDEAQKYGESIADGNIVNVMEVKASTIAKRKPTRAQAVKASKTSVKADWVSKGKKNKITKSFELGNFFLFELGKDFIGVSINNSYPDGKAWLGARTIKCADVDGLFAYLQKNLTDNATWNQIERTIANSEFEAKIDNMGGFVSDKDMSKPAKSVDSACSKKKSVKASYGGEYITDEFLSKVNNSYLDKQYQANDFEVQLDNGYLKFKCKTRKAKDLATKLAKQFYPEYEVLDIMKLGPKSVKASDVDADRPNSAPNSWKSSQRMAYKVTEDQTKGERTFPTSIDDVYKVLGEMQGTWTNPTTGWTGDCEIYERDLDDGSYIFSLVFGGNELEPDDILYDPNGFNYYSNKPKFTIYPHSGAPTFADSLEDFKRKLKKEYSYLKKVDSVKSSKAVKASAKDKSINERIDDFKRLKQVINDFCNREFGSDADFSNSKNVALAYTTYGDNDEWELTCTADLENLKLIYKVTYPDGSWSDRTENYRSFTDMADALEDVSFDDLMSLQYFPDLDEEDYAERGYTNKEVESSMNKRNASKKTIKASASAKRRASKRAITCAFDEGDPWEYQESYDYYYDEEPPKHIAKELERLAKLTDMYQDRWFEKFEELHPGERFSSVDPHPDVDEAVGYTLDEAEYSPDDIKASISEDELEPIMGDDFNDEDMGYGFDTSGEAISESMVDELCRIANEILDESELAKLGSWTDIDRDSFDYWCDGSSYVSEKFTITFTYTSELMTFNDFVKEDAWWTPSAEHGLGFNIQVKDGQVESVEYTDKYWVGNSTPLENAESIFDIERLEAYIAEIAAPVAMEIYNGTTNI